MVLAFSKLKARFNLEILQRVGSHIKCLLLRLIFWNMSLGCISLTDQDPKPTDTNWEFSSIKMVYLWLEFSKKVRLVLKESDIVLKHKDPFFDLELSRVKYRVDKEDARIFGELDTEN